MTSHTDEQTSGAWDRTVGTLKLKLTDTSTLVMSGSLVTALARRRNAKLLPVDSEHSAIFQAISTIYQRDPAATLNLGGIVFGLGCLMITLQRHCGGGSAATSPPPS
jgi:hypothetical protein